MTQKNIHRTDKKDKFTIIDNRLLKDRRLSFGAKGLAVVLLERPDDWKIYRRDMIKRGLDGRTNVDKFLDELEALGYLSRQRVRDDKGRFNGYRIQLYENAELNPFFKNELPISRFTAGGKPAGGKPAGGLSTGGFTAPTKYLRKPSTDLNQELTELKTNGTAEKERKQKKVMQGNSTAAAEILKILKKISLEMQNPLKAPESLVRNLSERGETAETTKRAWQACQENARKPSGAFIHFIRSGHLPQKPLHFQEKKSEDPPPSSATPPPTKEDELGAMQMGKGNDEALSAWMCEQKALRAKRDAELARMRAETMRGEG